MPVTNKGYSTRRFPELRQEIVDRLESELDIEINTAPDTILGTLVNIYADLVSQQENITQALYNQLDVDKATGTFLDRAVALVGMRRLDASPASGMLLVWRDGVGSTLSSVEFESVDDVRYVSVGGVTHSLESCNEVLVTPNPVTDNTEYAITINNVIYSYTTGTGATANEITSSLAGQIDGTTDISAVSESGKLRVNADVTTQNNLSVSYDSFLLDEIAVFTYVESVEEGLLYVEENTITNVVTANNAFLRCNNPLEFTDGRNIETDEELRARHAQRPQLSGKATVPAIGAALYAVNNVENVFVKENTTFSTDSQGRPPKSYECIVQGGATQDIASTVWDTKPAGVRTYGNTTTIVIDSDGNTQSVEWSRPEPVFILVRITYSLYDEESFPASGETAIKSAVTEYGDGLPLGKDIIPTRFIGGIYKNVNGVGNIQIEVGTTSNPNSIIPQSGWQTDPIPLDDKQFGSFSSNRVITRLQ